MEALQDTSYQYALISGLLSSIACGIIGTYVVVKRMALIGGGIAHVSLGGIGIAVYLGIAPLLGAAVFAMLSAVLIGLVSLHGGEHEDTLIGALWATGMAIGIIFVQMTPGFTGDLEDYLFGNLLAVTRPNLVTTGLLDVFILVTVLSLYKELLAITLDEEFARLRGLPVDALYIFLLCLIALTVVVLIQVVGVILVIALLTLPPAISRWFTARLSTMMILSCAIGATFSTLGIVASRYAHLPPGPCIILLAALVYAVGLGIRGMLSRRSQVA